MKLDIDIIAMDLDDTLLRHDLTISDRSVRTIKKAYDKGIKILLASGRTPDAMRGYASMIGLDHMDSYLICNNGAQAMKSDSRKIIFEHRLPVDVAIEAFRLTIDAGLTCHIYENDIIYVSKQTEYSERDGYLSGLQTLIPDDYEALIRKGTYKLVIPGDPEFLVPVESELKVIFQGRATIFVSKPFFLEILPLQAGKGEALKEIAEDLLGIPSSRVMAFGDSMNDESMIRYAFHGVAMKNARPEIQKIARHITDKTNDDDGLADFLETYVL